MPRNGCVLPRPWPGRRGASSRRVDLDIHCLLRRGSYLLLYGATAV